jgi:hypothetical protein
MTAVGFACPRCGCEIAEWISYRIHEGSVIVRLRCYTCRFEWDDVG